MTGYDQWAAAAPACVFALSACGSGLGCGAAGMAAVGAWKKCYFENRPAPFILLAFVGAPLSQTIYGLILMTALLRAPPEVLPLARLAMGLFGGLAMGLSAWQQGRAAAAAADALGATGKGFGNYLVVVGTIETVALFVMVFLLRLAT